MFTSSFQVGMAVLGSELTSNGHFGVRYNLQRSFDCSGAGNELFRIPTANTNLPIRSHSHEDTTLVDTGTMDCNLIGKPKVLMPIVLSINIKIECRWKINLQSDQQTYSLRNDVFVQYEL